jgi:FkbM family methyltransferase
MTSKPPSPLISDQILPERIRELVRSERPIILDVGANDGMQTLQFLSLFPGATVYAFEPDPRALAKFRANVADPRVRLFEGALGSIDGEAEFHVSSGLPPGVPQGEIEKSPGGWDRSGSLRAPKSHKEIWPWCKFESKITVQVKRLDTWARENAIETVDFLWADVQGAEGDLISGGAEILSRTRYFYTEYSNKEWYEGQVSLQQIFGMLRDFIILDLFPMDVLLKNTGL